VKVKLFSLEQREQLMRFDGYTHSTQIPDGLAVQTHISLFVVDAGAHLQAELARLFQFFVFADVGPTALDTSAQNLTVLASFRSADAGCRAVFAAVLVLEMHANASPSARPLPLAIFAVEPALAVLADGTAVAIFARGPEAIVLAARLALAISALAANAIMVAYSLATTFSAVDFLAPVLALAILLISISFTNTFRLVGVHHSLCHVLDSMARLAQNKGLARRHCFPK